MKTQCMCVKKLERFPYLQEREGAVIKLHLHTGEVGLNLRNLNKLENHGLVLAKHLARGDAKQGGIA
jgi:hypothetical protein